MVSVIVPIYNAEKYLDRCVTSIINQTYQDIEVILINDGSTDGSIAICEKYAQTDKRVRYIEKENEGIGKTRFCALQYINGEYFCFVDSDDYIAENAVELLLDNMSNEVDCVIGQHERFGDAVSIKQVQLPVGIVEFTDKEHKNYIDEIINSRHAVEEWNKLYRTQLAKEIWSIPITVKFGEDILYTMAYLSGCRAIKCINDVTYFYEYKENSLARNSKKTMILLDFVKTCIELENIICTKTNMQNLYPLLVASVCSNALVKYAAGDDCRKTKTIEDIENMSHSTTMKRYAKVFMKNQRQYISQHGLNDNRFYEYWSIYKSVLHGDAWYYTKLYPALLEEKRIFVVKAIINKIIGRVKK